MQAPIARCLTWAVAWSSLHFETNSAMVTVD